MVMESYMNLHLTLLVDRESQDKLMYFVTSSDYVNAYGKLPKTYTRRAVGPMVA
jgi:hypothetical protein